MSGLPADSYYVVELPEVGDDAGDGWQDPLVLDTLAAGAAFVVVNEGGQTSVSLRR